ncbi:MAG: hypothetical protein HKO88_13505 [Xanthomonadales bacterium]|nr:hypothetical protein [Xanthomonadales bacterium]
MRVLFLLLCSLLTSSIADHSFAQTADGKSREQAVSPQTLSALAAKADLVAVAQVKDTDYVFTRSFPSEGSAFLQLLITYKKNKPGEEIVEVYEKGLHPHECYFENPTVLEEGRRFLVFFRLDEEDPEIYRGLPEGCALEILVTGDNRYALKFPLKGMDIADELEQLATEYDFRDSYAVFDDDSISPSEREELLDQGLIRPYQGKFKYTHGIDLTTARNLISAEALKSKRNW